MVALDADIVNGLGGKALAANDFDHDRRARRNRQ